MAQGYGKALAYRFIRDRHDMWSLINQTIRMGGRIITFGLLIRLLGSTELALWYMFVALFGVSRLIEGGGKTAITRQCAYHATKSIRALRFFLVAVLRIYSSLALAVGIIATSLGLLWFKAFSGVEVGDHTVWLWCLFVTANVLGLLTAVLGGALSGLEGVARAQRNEACSMVVNLGVFVSLWMVMPDAGLWIPVSALLVSSLVGLGLNVQLLHERLIGFWLTRLRRNYMHSVVMRYMRETGQIFVGVLAFHLLTSVFLLLLAAYQPSGVVAAYGVTMQMFNLVLSFVNIWTYSSFPRWASASSMIEASEELKAVLSRAVPALAIGLLAASIIGPQMLLLWKGSKVILDGAELWVLVGILFHECVFAINAQFLISRGYSARVSRASVCYAVAFLLAAWAFFSGLQASLILILIARISLGVLLYDIPIGIASLKIAQWRAS